MKENAAAPYFLTGVSPKTVLSHRLIFKEVISVFKSTQYNLAIFAALQLYRFVTIT